MRKHLELLLISLFAIIAFCAFSQEPTGQSSQDKMAYFEFMTGEWVGPVDIPNKDGSTTKIMQHEVVQDKLNGNMILIEGTGINEEGEVAFNAVATIFYDQKKSAYRMFAWRDNGQFTEAAVNIIDEGHFEWSFSPNPKTFIRYEAKVADDVWTETGFYSPDGESWNQFFHMALDKKQ